MVDESVVFEYEARTKEAQEKIEAFNSKMRDSGDVSAIMATKLERANNRVESAGISATRSSGAFSSFNKTVGDLPGILLNVADQLDNVNDKTNAMHVSAGKAMQGIGGLGSATLITAAAFTGWEIGKKIDELTGIGKVVEDLTSSMIDFSNATHDAATEAQNIQANAALGAAVMKKYNLSVDDYIKLSDKFKGNNAAINATLKAQQDATTKAADAFEKKYNAAIRDSNEAILDFHKSSTQLRDEALATAQSLAGLGFKNLSDEQKAELLKAQANFKKYSLQVMEEDKQMNEARVRNAEQTAERRRKALAKEADDFAEAMQKLTEDSSIGSMLDSNLGSAVLGTIVGGGRKIREELDAIAAEAMNADFSIGKMLDNDKGMDQLAQTIGGIPTELLEADAAAKQLDATLQKVSQWASIFGMLANSIDGFVGDLFGGVSNGLNTFGGMLDDFTSGKLKNLTGMSNTSAAAIGGIGSALQSVGNAIGGTAGKIVSAAGSIATAFATGGPWGAAIAAVGLLTSALTKLFKKDWGKEAKKMASDIGFAISDELAKSIGDLGKKLGDTDTAIELSLGRIADEVGVTAENLQNFMSRTRDVFSFLERGDISAAQAVDVLNDMFPRLAAVATDAFGRISPGLKEIIALAKQFGLEVPAIAEFMKQQVDTLANSLGPMLAAIQQRIDESLKADPSKSGLRKFTDDAKGLAAIVLETFNQIIANGGSVQDALAAIGPNITQLRDMFKELGLSLGDVGLGFLNQLNNINQKFPESVAAINAATQALVALDNMGMLTKNNFKTLQDQILAAFGQINKDGKVSKAELAQMMPTLQLLANLALQYGYALDPATIALLKQAGLWDEVHNKPKQTGDATKDAMTTAAAAIQEAADAMKDLVAALRDGTTAASDMGSAVANIPTDVNVNVHFTGDEAPNTGEPATGGRRRIRSFSGLDHPLTFTRPETIRVHDGETLMPSPENDRGGHQPPAQIFITTNDPNYILSVIRKAQRNGEI